MLFFNNWINFKLINMRNIILNLFSSHKNIRTYEIKNMRTRRIIPYRMLLITGLSLVRKINILLWVYKTGKVYILHAKNMFPFVVYIFFWMHNFLIFYSLNIFVFKWSIFWPMWLYPVLIIQSNCCLNVIAEFHPRMKMYMYPAPGTMLLNCTWKRNRYIHI